MKMKLIYFFVLFVWLAIGSIVQAATITWANTNGGDWNIATNWTPAQVPVSGDNVIITTNGTYTVTNSSSATLGNLILGGTNGIQTLTLSSLTLTNIGLVNSNGVLNWGGGEVDGGLTVAQGGVLNITNNATTYYIHGSLTNNGTVNWSAGSIYGYGPPSYNGLIYNAGLWNAQFDGSLNLASGTPAFINAGIFRKSGGTGITTIGWNFTSTGIFDIQTGSLSCSTWVGNSILNGNYTGTIGSADTNTTQLVASNAVFNWDGGEVDGGLTVAQGGVLNITNNATTYYIHGSLTNNGTVNWSAGSIYGYGPPSYNGLVYNAGLWNAQFDGSLTLASGTPAFINAGTFRKSGGTGITYIYWNFTSTGTFDVQTGSLSCSTWANNNTLNGNYTGSGTINSGVSLTVASNAVFNWSGGEVDGALTVAQGGVLNITNNAATYYIQGSLTNNGTVNWSAGSIYGYGPPSYNGLIYNAGLWNAQFDGSLTLASGTPAFINTGTFRKSGGTGITYIYWNFTSTGILDIQTGSLSTSAWVGNNILNGDYTGTISVNSNATVTVPASVTVNWTGGTIDVGGVFNVSSNGVVNWSGGEVDGALTVAQGGVLNITNNTTYYIQGSLTNNGTVNWSAGSIYGYGPPSYNGLIYNAGLWNAQFDGSLNLASGTPAFINTGTFRKSGGTGITYIYWNFTSTGTFDVQTGSLSCSTWVGNSILNGNWTGAISLTDTNATVLVASNAVLNWSGGTISGALAVAQGGVLNITNNATTYYVQGSLTNNGTVNWSAGSIYGYGPPSYNGLIYNAGLWNEQFDGSLNLASGTPAFINAGTFRKSGGIGISYIYWNFTNRFGILDAQTNTMSLAGNYDLTGGTLNFGISSLTGYGIIDLSGSPATLTGTLSANFNAGFLPAVNNSWQIINYTTSSGVFSQTNLPPIAVWQVTGSATSLTIKVLKLVPQMSWPLPSDIVYGTALGSSQLDATASWNSSPVSGSFIYTPPLGTVLQSGSNQTLSVTFMPADTTTYINVTTNVVINVQKAPLTVTANSRAKTYGQTVTFAGTEFNTAGLVNGDTVTSATLASAGAPPVAPVSGSPYAITITNALGDAGLTNYNITYANGALTVNKAALGITANNRGKTYGQNITFAGTEFTSVGLQNAETIGTVTLVSAGAISNAPVSGSPYSIVPGAATGGTFSPGNYAITYTNGVLTVNKAALGITANNRGKTYGQNITFAGTEFVSSPLQNAETIGTVTLVSAGAISNAPVSGSPYSIVPSAATGGTFTPGNYAIAYTNGVLTVSPASLGITANNRVKTYGQTVTFAGTEFTSSGLQNLETVGSVTLTSPGAIATASVAGSPYNITPSAATGGTFTPGNYTIAYTNGALTVNKATLTITANSTNKIVGETLTFAGTEFTAAGLQNSETIGTVTLTSAGALSSAVAGPYNIVPSAPVGGTFSQGNYSDIFVDGTLTVFGVPELTLTALGSQYVLTFPSLSGQIYQLQSKTNLALPAWSSLGGTINGTGGTVNVTNTITVPQSFFQLQIAP
jgi:hypothetical protein